MQANSRWLHSIRKNMADITCYHKKSESYEREAKRTDTYGPQRDGHLYSIDYTKGTRFIDISAPII